MTILMTLIRSQADRPVVFVIIEEYMCYPIDAGIKKGCTGASLLLELLHVAHERKFLELRSRNAIDDGDGGMLPRLDKLIVLL